MKNFNDILQTLITVNEQLIDNKIDIEKAKVIGQNTQILINAAKVQLEYARQTKQTPAFLNELKQSTYKDIIGDIKEIAQKAVEMNNTEEEEITDKRPFPFN